MKMLKLFRRKSVAAAAGVTLAVVLVYAVFGNNNPITSVVQTIFTPALTLTSKISDSVGGFKDYLIEIKVYKEENDRLNNELNKMKLQNREVSELTSENERLAELLNLKNDLDYETKAAQVIYKEPDSHNEIFVVNKGTESGITQGAAVLTPSGIAGRVTETGIGWSRVSSVLNQETAVGVRIVRTGALAVSEGTRGASNESFCKLSFFDKGADMMNGDIVETTGAAGIYPPGLAVGTIAKIQTDADGREYAIIEPAVDFEGLYEVLIVTGVAKK